VLVAVFRLLLVALMKVRAEILRLKACVPAGGEEESRTLLRRSTGGGVFVLGCDVWCVATARAAIFGGCLLARGVRPSISARHQQH